MGACLTCLCNKKALQEKDGRYKDTSGYKDIYLIKNVCPSSVSSWLARTFSTMATRAVVGRGLRETGAALKHASGLEVCVIVYIPFVIFSYPQLAYRHRMGCSISCESSYTNKKCMHNIISCWVSFKLNGTCCAKM